MSDRENAQALSALVALLPDASPERRDAEADAYLTWKRLDPAYANSLASAWIPEKTPHLERVVAKLCRVDPATARRLLPRNHWRADAMRRAWLESILSDWRPGDGKTVASLLRSYHEYGDDSSLLPRLRERLADLPPAERSHVLLPLLQKLRASYRESRRPEALAQLLAHANEAATTERFQESLARLVFERSERESDRWRRALRRELRARCPTPSAEQAALFRLARVAALARAFETRYKLGKPRRRLTGRFVARWRRLEESSGWIDALPTPWLRATLLARRARLVAGTAAWLRAEATQARAGCPPAADTAVLRVGEALAIRIPSELAVAGGFDEGETVRLTMKEGALLVERAGR